MYTNVYIKAGPRHEKHKQYSLVMRVPDAHGFMCMKMIVDV